MSRPDGTMRRQLTGDTAIDRLPRWSPDGRWVAFFSSRAGMLHLWKVRADGSDLRRLSPMLASSPVWSPDGARLATVSGPPLGSQVALLDAERLAEDQRLDTLPTSPIGRFLANSWSPDGRRLAGQLGDFGRAGRGIATYSFDTRHYEKLTDFGEWPVWLPDSRRILFVARGNAFYVVDSRTREVREVFSVDRDVIGPPRLSRDGNAAYFSRRVTEGDIWMVTLEPDR